MTHSFHLAFLPPGRGPGPVSLKAMIDQLLRWAQCGTRKCQLRRSQISICSPMGHTLALQFRLHQPAIITVYTKPLKIEMGMACGAQRNEVVDLLRIEDFALITEGVDLFFAQSLQLLQLEYVSSRQRAHVMRVVALAGHALEIVTSPNSSASAAGSHLSSEVLVLSL